jgi:CRP/FNR family transcriptional regulator
MTSALLVALRATTLRAMLESDAGVARACAAELARQVQDLLIDVAEQAFLSVRQRLARELLVLAARGPGRDLVVTASQQELADAIGSVREVVARTLHALQEDGLVRVGRGGIELLDPMRLTDELGTRAAAGIAQVGRG